VLELCDPHGFESAVLACKTLHQVANPLLPNHSLCKSFVLDPALEWTKWGDGYGGYRSTGHLVTRDPAKFMLRILKMPANIQLQVFRYFKRVIIFPSVMGEHVDLAEKRFSKSSTLKEVAPNVQGLTDNTPGIDGG
jgi:hypothetical protein